MNRAILVRLANEASVGSMRAGAPTLREDSPREFLLAWLVWNDGNGCYRDADLVAEGEEPMTLDEAWEQIATTLEDDWNLAHGRA